MAGSKAKPKQEEEKRARSLIGKVKVNNIIDSSIDGCVRAWVESNLNWRAAYSIKASHI